MTTSTDEPFTHIRFLVRVGYWSALIGGLNLPWVIILLFDHFGRQVPWAQAWRSFYLHLFAPGYNFFLIGVLNMVGFIVFAVILLFHLGKAPLSEPATIRRRAWALGIAGLTMAGVSAWTHVSVLLYPESQGALAYIFLPVTLLVCLAAGYAAGWLCARWSIPSSLKPT